MKYFIRFTIFSVGLAVLTVISAITATKKYRCTVLSGNFDKYRIIDTYQKLKKNVTSQKKNYGYFQKLSQFFPLFLLIFIQ